MQLLVYLFKNSLLSKITPKYSLPSIHIRYIKGIRVYNFYLANRNNEMSESVVIVAAKRTPMGGFMGVLSNVPSPVLGASAINAVMTDVPSDAIDEVIMGCVLQ
jgi:hypothetical protein